jgi:hypothetical protein
MHCILVAPSMALKRRGAAARVRDWLKEKPVKGPDANVAAVTAS